MNCLLAVGQGSARPPRLIVLEHAPAGHEQEKPLVLVGKGITFDTGGICLKPAANMHAMKGDMSGAAAVLATLVACAGDELPCRVVGIMACAENMPGGNAMRPGDVVRAASGDTVEIQNTDAEGRLALCDALDYAQKQWTPAAVVDIATLTGACAVALGTQVAGLFCDDDALAEHIRAAGAVGGENYWPLPCGRATKTTSRARWRTSATWARAKAGPSTRRSSSSISCVRACAGRIWTSPAWTGQPKRRRSAPWGPRASAPAPCWNWRVEAFK